MPSALRPGTVAGFLDGLPLVFQRNKAKDLEATYRFVFTGTEAIAATIDIRHEISPSRMDTRAGRI